MIAFSAVFFAAFISVLCYVITVVDVPWWAGVISGIVMYIYAMSIMIAMEVGE